MFEPEVLQSLKIFVYRDLKMHTQTAVMRCLLRTGFHPTRAMEYFLGAEAGLSFP